jgi:hypothetical protein
VKRREGLGYAGEKDKPTDAMAAPDVADVQIGIGDGIRVLALEPLVRMNLVSYRLKDQVHLQDMIGVGLIEQSWVGRFPVELATRLQKKLDDPNG